jgi:hypothetical protein
MQRTHFSYSFLLRLIDSLDDLIGYVERAIEIDESAAFLNG